uniref:testis-expressed protein 26-like isoform X2 n=1 Tax=Epinephelus lanceolatus TaxID=310571 RepID=UPI001446C48A|nr:testis-expressed protein 26-like isoform X2 [Epinephelus lanceolatus]
MATKEGKQWWDPYETSNRRQFIYRPNSAAEILLCPASTSFIDSYSQSGPFGSTVYNKDFCWQPGCKPECIRTGTASGQRRNNPHPSQSFMMWRLPRDAARSSEYVSFPWKCPPSEREIHKALTAQYRSIYRCDFMGMPQVPTVVQRHAQQKRSDLTNYDRFCGKRVNDVTCVIKSLLPQELQQLHRILPEEEREAIKTVLSKDCPNNREKVNKLPAVVLHPRSPEWISSWPGPL